jgi:hypothetical protein
MNRRGPDVGVVAVWVVCDNSHDGSARRDVFSYARLVGAVAENGPVIALRPDGDHHVRPGDAGLLATVRGFDYQPATMYK